MHCQSEPLLGPRGWRYIHAAEGKQHRRFPTIIKNELKYLKFMTLKFKGSKICLTIVTFSTPTFRNREGDVVLNATESLWGFIPAAGGDMRFDLSCNQRSRRWDCDKVIRFTNIRAVHNAKRRSPPCSLCLTVIVLCARTSHYRRVKSKSLLWSNFVFVLGFVCFYFDRDRQRDQADMWIYG